ncbi:asparagine synthase-related protein [Oceanobacillus saliphilus]|uniref:asparagine synthase-related protein n=1 Tax=Oceanobacillus saliphilus TaxID=2925834 RepID=UPI00201D4EC2|nr:asparagine synthase-related protein [Oceanobacillus saliphilus]
MGAITGILHFNKKPISKEDSYKLVDSFEHFPSDAIHTWTNQNIFLGCHAQWITPESVGEQMPYYDYDRQLAITADVIIDNRDELFQLLQINREQQKTIPDSRLILLAYSKWGEETPKYLQGDFAFMIWDEKNQKLFGARDFSGARTLYFYRNENSFAFSTTINPLFTLPYVKKELNEEWLAEFLAIPTMVEAVDMFSTVYKSIHQVPPSHSITVSKGNVSLSRYCTIDVKEELKLNSNEEYEEAFRDFFQKAVHVRLRTHGEVGSQLSGGLDSGSVVSFAAKALKGQQKPLHTFSYVPEDSFTDWTSSHYIANETPYIKETVNHVGNISDNYLDFNGRNSLSEVDDFLDIMEMPYKFFENSFWLKGINETAQQKGVKVLLNGARGNHSISWGSMNLTYNFYTDLLKKAHLIRLYKELDAYCNNFGTGKSVMIPFVAKRAISQAVKKERSISLFPTFINPSFAHKTQVFEKLESYGFDLNSSPQNLTEYRKNYYQQLFPWNKSGVAETKLSLRYGLWNRDPTNDLNVIRFCLSLPKDQYVIGGMDRSIIRRSMKGLLPDNVRLNQSVRGIQGADVVHRMTPGWGIFINELQEIANDKELGDFINLEVINDALLKIGTDPKQELIFTNEFKLLTRSLIVYRFIKRF